MSAVCHYGCPRIIYTCLNARVGGCPSSESLKNEVFLANFNFTYHYINENDELIEDITAQS